MEKKKIKNDEIIRMVNKCIKIATTKLKLARYLNVEWTTVDRWKTGMFRPKIDNYLKLQKLIERGKI